MENKMSYTWIFVFILGLVFTAIGVWMIKQ
ncbi:MAG: hypothetical protein JXA21_21135 [Anaerolineae bacterium]|nr:hypothetical protein [Anaerolineae bacterium]